MPQKRGSQHAHAAEVATPDYAPEQSGSEESQKREATEAQMDAPAQPLLPTEADPLTERTGEAAEGTTGHRCANCGEIAVWRTTNAGANRIYFCDKDRPQGEGVERIDG